MNNPIFDLHLHEEKFSLINRNLLHKVYLKSVSKVYVKISINNFLKIYLRRTKEFMSFFFFVRYNT